MATNSLVQWQQRVTARYQREAETLQKSTIAKLRLISRHPLQLSGKALVKYVLLGIQSAEVAIALTVHQPRTVTELVTLTWTGHWTMSEIM